MRLSSMLALPLLGGCALSGLRDPEDWQIQPQPAARAASQNPQGPASKPANPAPRITVRPIVHVVNLNAFRPMHTYGSRFIDAALHDPRVHRPLFREVERWTRLQADRLVLADDQPSQEAYAPVLSSLRKSTRRASRIAFADVQRDPTYRSVENHLHNLASAWDASPAGMWVDDNSGSLIVAGSLLTVGGLGWMYKQRAEMPSAIDTGLNTLLRQGLVSGRVGDYDISLRRFRFRPSQRLIGAEVRATGRLRRVPVATTARFEAVDGRLQSWQAEASAVFDLGSGSHSPFRYGIAASEEQRRLRLDVVVSDDRTRRTEYALNMHLEGPRMSGSLEAKTNFHGQSSLAVMFGVTF